jgi:shikimate dehydrogenase
MHTIGLLGESLKHSFSQHYFTKKFIDLGINQEWQYLNFDITCIEDLPKIIAEYKPIGFNVTLPYKETILPFIDELNEPAETIGAVNTVLVTYHKDGTYRLKGYNTDTFGFHQMIKPFLELHHERALILGNGGAAKAVQFVLKNYGIELLFAIRNPSYPNQLSLQELNEYVIKHHLLIINCTPLGMYPNVTTFPSLPYELLTEKHLLIDLVYNPSETEFLKKGKQFGAKTLNGLTMLHQQAEKAWDLFRSNIGK